MNVLIFDKDKCFRIRRLKLRKESQLKMHHFLFSVALHLKIHFLCTLKFGGAFYAIV